MFKICSIIFSFEWVGWQTDKDLRCPELPGFGLTGEPAEKKMTALSCDLSQIPSDQQGGAGNAEPVDLMLVQHFHGGSKLKDIKATPRWPLSCTSNQLQPLTASWCYWYCVTTWAGPHESLSTPTRNNNVHFNSNCWWYVSVCVDRATSRTEQRGNSETPADHEL